jgi:hypothetical protein
MVAVKLEQSGPSDALRPSNATTMDVNPSCHTSVVRRVIEPIDIATRVPYDTYQAFNGSFHLDHQGGMVEPDGSSTEVPGSNSRPVAKSTNGD